MSATTRVLVLLALFAAGCSPSDEVSAAANEDGGPGGIQIIDGQAEIVPSGGLPCFERSQLAGTRVALLGAYEGGTPLPSHFAGDSHAAKMILVAAERDGPPLLLVLSAYDPVVWDFAAFPAERLRGVLVYGYHPQGVAHLPPTIPVRFSTHDLPSAACGRPGYAYQGGPDLDRLVVTIEQAVGRAPESFYGAYEASGLHVERGPVGLRSDRLDLGQTRLSAPLDRDDVPPGEEGIRHLIETGAIRPAGPQDVEAYNRAAGRRSRSSHLAPYRTEGLDTVRTFVVLRRITAPAGMYGAHSASFIVPSGVAPPRARGSHNSYYLVESGTCLGVCW